MSYFYERNGVANFIVVTCAYGLKLEFVGSKMFDDLYVIAK